MSNFIQPPGSGQTPQQPATNVQINPKDLEDIKCDKCGNFTFTRVVLMKRVPAIVSPHGQDGVVPTEIFACAVCNNIPRVLLDGLAQGWFRGESMQSTAEKQEETIEGSQLPGLNLVKPNEKVDEDNISGER